MVKSVNAALTEAQKSSDFEAKKSNSNPDLAQTITIDIEQISEAKVKVQAVAKKQIKKDIGHKTELKTQVTNSVKALVKKQYLSPKIQSFDQYMTQALEQSQQKDHEMTDAQQAQFDTNVNSSPRISNTSSQGPDSPTGNLNLILTESQKVQINGQSIKKVQSEQLLGENQEINEKYYKKFDFFYRRTAFRSMTEFYKGLFKPDLDKWREGERKSTKNFLHQYLWKKSQIDSKKYQKLQVLVKQQQQSQKLANLPNQSNKISDKIKESLEDVFLPLENESAQLPVSESDLKSIKHNIRKQALYEQAYYFCDKLFSISEKPSDMEEDDELESPMNTSQILVFTSAILSIVLSHHFQKEDIRKMIQGTTVDFQMVRDTMYKYSKKAEERYFTNPCFAYFFIQFAKSEQGKNYIESKLGNSGQNMDDEINQPSNVKQSKSKVGQISKKLDAEEAIERQKEMNERIASEIEVMSSEAQDFLLKSYEKDLNQLYIKCKPQFENLDQTAQINLLRAQSQDTLISHVLLQNIGVNCEQLISQKIQSISQSRNAPVKKEKPLIDSILEDISLERLKRQQQEVAFTPQKEGIKNVASFLNTKSTACDSSSPFKTSAQKLFSSTKPTAVSFDKQDQANKIQQILPLIKLLSAKKLAKGCQPFEGSAAGPQKITKTLSFGQNLFSRGDFPTPKKDLFLNKIDEKFNKSPKSSESSHSNTVLKPTIFSPVLINAKNQSNGISLEKSMSKQTSSETKQQQMQQNNAELVQKLLSITQNLLQQNEIASKNAPKDVQMNE